jgi:hypothetical protein
VIVLADNDLILKLARCDLLKSLPEILGCTFDDIRIAPAARFQLMPSKPEKALRKCGDQATVERLAAFLAVVRDIEAVTDLDMLGRLATVPKIDSGEQLLFTACASDEKAILLTGDRTALRALASNQEVVGDVYKKLARRVITFESALLIARKLYGFETIRARLLAYPDYGEDKMLRYIVRPDMIESNFVEAMVSYSREVCHYLAQQDSLPTELFAPINAEAA